MGLFLAWLVLSILVGFYAASKAHSGGGWFLLSLLISPLICFLIELLRPANTRTTERRAIDSGEMKKCPACAELVRAEATKCRYCGEALAAVAAGLTCSMSRQGDVWDNSAMESFFSTLKTERVNRKVYRTRDEARANSTIGYVSPVEFEQNATCSP